MVQHPWPLLEISLSDFRRLAMLNMITYLPTEIECIKRLEAKAGVISKHGQCRILNSLWQITNVDEEEKRTEK